jgi:serine acetyltransferase
MILNMVCLCGWVTVGAHARISPASTVIERTRIGSGSHVGIGSLVLKNVPGKTVVYGRPAKPRIKNKKKSANKQAIPAKTAAPVNKRTGVAAGKNKFVRRRKYGYRT